MDAVGVGAAVATPERLKSLTFFVPNFSYFVQQEEAAAAYVAAFQSLRYRKPTFKSFRILAQVLNVNLRLKSNFKVDHTHTFSRQP